MGAAFQESHKGADHLEVGRKVETQVGRKVETQVDRTVVSRVGRKVESQGVHKAAVVLVDILGQVDSRRRAVGRWVQSEDIQAHSRVARTRPAECCSWASSSLSIHSKAAKKVEIEINEITATTDDNNRCYCILSF